MRILIATDAWYPQVNGVVRTLEETARELRAMGHQVLLLTPEGHATIPLPLYSEIRLAIPAPGVIARAIEAFTPDAIYVATEGLIGLAARRWCLRHGMRFATGFHTRFPEFAAARLPLPGVVALGYEFLRWFHAPSSAILVPTAFVAKDLAASGFANLKVWTRGVDQAVFSPDDPLDLGMPRPVMLYAGRVSIEKGLDDFLKLELPGAKVVVGDGPDRLELSQRYPKVQFAGYRFGRDLARHIAAADVFVFPSRVDTFGLVMLEAMACGVPVAAYPVQGPVDVVVDGVSGALDGDLGAAIGRALQVPRADCRAYALDFTWRRTAEMFLDHLVPVVGRPQQVA
ncbi:MAG TPA: glycosyltransferase family 1 protein [Aestuariivirgaceae bacterium]|nr:glycosyltransferase family 1 protein [Aestuariivirgaceae bacterium]